MNRFWSDQKNTNMGEVILSDVFNNLSVFFSPKKHVFPKLNQVFLFPKLYPTVSEQDTKPSLLYATHSATKARSRVGFQTLFCELK